MTQYLLGESALTFLLSVLLSPAFSFPLTLLLLTVFPLPALSMLLLIPVPTAVVMALFPTVIPAAPSPPPALATTVLPPPLLLAILLPPHVQHVGLAGLPLLPHFFVGVELDREDVDCPENDSEECNWRKKNQFSVAERCSVEFNVCRVSLKFCTKTTSHLSTATYTQCPLKIGARGTFWARPMLF